MGAKARTYVSWREFLGGSHAASLVLVCLGVWLHAADGLIVATMLPAIVAEIGGASLVAWTVALYEVGSIVAGFAGALAIVRFGLRLPMSLAAAVFGLGCAVAALSPIMPLVLAGRALQGLGGGGLVAMSFVAVGMLFPRRYTARAMAAISMLWGMSAFLGPLIGGLFVEFATWRWGFVFFAVQAFALAGWIAVRADLPGTSTEGHRGDFPLRRLAGLSLAVVLIASGGVVIDALRTSAFIAAGIACFAGFLWLERRAGDGRLLPSHPFDLRRPAGAALLMILSMSTAVIAMGAFGPLLMIAIHGVTPLAAGYILASASVGWSLMAVVVSGTPERYDRIMIAVGMTIVALGLVGFLIVVPSGPPWLIAVATAIEGGGFGMAWTFVLRRATALAPEREASRIAGALPTVQRLGYALGAAYAGIVANASGFLSITTPAEAATVARLIFAAGLPLAALGLVAMFALVRARPG